jgi:hypothetical protein
MNKRGNSRAFLRRLVGSAHGNLNEKIRGGLSLRWDIILDVPETVNGCLDRYGPALVSCFETDIFFVTSPSLDHDGYTYHGKIHQFDVELNNSSETKDPYDKIMKSKDVYKCVDLNIDQNKWNEAMEELKSKIKTVDVEQMAMKTAATVDTELLMSLSYDLPTNTGSTIDTKERPLHAMAMIGYRTEKLIRK